MHANCLCRESARPGVVYDETKAVAATYGRGVIDGEAWKLATATAAIVSNIDSPKK